MTDSVAWGLFCEDRPVPKTVKNVKTYSDIFDNFFVQGNKNSGVDKPVKTYSDIFDNFLALGNRNSGVDKMLRHIFDIFDNFHAGP